MKEIEIPRESLQGAMTPTQQKQTRDILVLYYKQNFTTSCVYRR